MGLFMKKTYNTCGCCGEQYESYMQEENMLCFKCMSKHGLFGYVELKDVIDKNAPKYTADDWKTIIEKRNAILEPCKIVGGLTIEELRDASINYKEYSEEQCEQFVGKLAASLLPASLGGLFTRKFIMPASFSGVVVNPEDVFAIALGYPLLRDKPAGTDVVSIGFFTNDPTAPMFAVGTAFEVKGLSLKNKKAREELKEELAIKYPNLKYPVMDYKDFMKVIKKEKTVNGNLSKDLILKYVERLDTDKEPFKISDTFTSDNNSSIMNQYGYIYSDQVETYILSDRKAKKFWCDKLNVSNNTGAQLLASAFDAGMFFVKAVRFMSRL